MYRETRFRSRLEARWAAFFDLVGWRWTYEPFDTGGWIPDFLIHGDAPLLIEVGPCISETDYRVKAEKPLRARDHVTLVVGVSPLLELEIVDGVRWPFAGLLVNEAPGLADPVEWSRCDACRAIGVQPDGAGRPCGHPFSVGSPTDHEVTTWWSRAGNAVQWRP